MHRKSISEYLINGNIYFVVIKEGFFSEFPSEHLVAEGGYMNQ